MKYNGVAPQDRATAQILIVMGSLLTLGGIAGLIFFDLSESSGRGIPMWIAVPVVTVFGVGAVVQGIRMWRRNKPPAPPA